jgi:hypothetical protein
MLDRWARRHMTAVQDARDAYDAEHTPASA